MNIQAAQLSLAQAQHAEESGAQWNSAAYITKTFSPSRECHLTTFTPSTGKLWYIAALGISPAGTPVSLVGTWSVRNQVGGHIAAFGSPFSWSPQHINIGCGISRPMLLSAGWHPSLVFSATTPTLVASAYYVEFDSNKRILLP